MKLSIMIITLFLGSCLFSEIIYVPEDYGTIQEGIDASSDGDEVIVSPGTYVENINYSGKLIVVGSLFHTTQDTSYISQTIIDGSQGGSTVTFSSGEDYTSILSGFSITNAQDVGWGGGIYCWETSPRLENLIVRDNLALYRGGGVYCYSSNPILENVVIKNNTSWSYGGGLYCSYSSNPILRNVTITGNSADWEGGGIYCNISSPVLENVTIADNLAGEEGGGIYCLDSSCVSMVNCILWNNMLYEIQFSSYLDPNTVTIAYTDIENGEDGIITEDNGTVNWLEGNIDDNPLFVDAQADDYSLSEDSPCIDAGTDFFEYEGEVLVDLSEEEYFGIAPDMGAFEYDVLNYGDIEDNGMVESYDASLILMYVVGLDPLPEIDPLPWEDWRIERADINLSDDIGAIDAAYILQYVAGIIYEFPVINNVRLAAGEISINHDTEYIYLNCQREIFSLECELTDPENMTFGLPEVLHDNVLFCNKDNKFALISAFGIIGNIVKIPYQVEEALNSIVSFKIEDNGNLYKVEYTFEEQVAEQCGMISVYPNPFNPETTISFFTKEGTESIEISIFNIKGQKVTTLVDDHLEAGNYTVTWNASDMSSGVYFSVLVLDGEIVSSQKMLLLK